jgi:hypothetical protein
MKKLTLSLVFIGMLIYLLKCSYDLRSKDTNNIELFKEEFYELNDSTTPEGVGIDSVFVFAPEIRQCEYKALYYKCLAYSYRLMNIPDMNINIENFKKNYDIGKYGDPTLEEFHDLYYFKFYAEQILKEHHLL